MHPCLSRGEYGDGGQFLAVNDSPAAVVALFEERGLQGGGYTWIALLHSLATLATPPIVGDYAIDGEGDNAFVNAKDPRILDAFEKVAEKALTDLSFLKRALDQADPEMLE